MNNQFRTAKQIMANHFNEQTDKLLGQMKLASDLEQVKRISAQADAIREFAVNVDRELDMAIILNQ